jgi:hypothetical protein
VSPKRRIFEFLSPHQDVDLQRGARASDFWRPVPGCVHTFHLGLWFESPADAARVGGPSITTPFNGQHNAGIQILNASNFPNLDGPLRKITP